MAKNSVPIPPQPKPLRGCACDEAKGIICGYHALQWIYHDGRLVNPGYHS